MPAITTVSFGGVIAPEISLFNRPEGIFSREAQAQSQLDIIQTLW
jgi:hypothetical protein